MGQVENSSGHLQSPVSTDHLQPIQESHHIGLLGIFFQLQPLFALH